MFTELRNIAQRMSGNFGEERTVYFVPRENNTDSELKEREREEPLSKLRDPFGVSVPEAYSRGNRKILSEKVKQPTWLSVA